MLKRLLFGGESGLSVQANIGLTLLRIFTGVALMMAHGIGQLPPSEGLVTRAGEVGFPTPTVFAWAAAFSLFVGVVFLDLGFLTRASSFFICYTMLTEML